VEHVILPYGAPEKLLTDRGSEFKEVMLEVNECLGVKKINTTAYHPQTDGEVERFNSTLKEQLRAACGLDHSAWDEKLPYILSAYNATPHPSTGEIPFFVMHGRDYKMPLDQDLGAGQEPAGSLQQRRSQLVTDLEKVHARVRRSLKDTAQKMKERYDETRTEKVDIKKGQLVLVRNMKKPEKGQSASLLPLWEGPFRVQTKKGLNLDLVHVTNPARKEWVHLDRVKPFAEAPERKPLVEDEFEVEDIIGEKLENGRKFYLVRWRGFTPKHDSLEPEEGLTTAAELLQRFRRSRTPEKDSSPGKAAPEKREVEDSSDDDEDSSDEGSDSDKTVDYGPDGPRRGSRPRRPVGFIQKNYEAK
jgi:hypothetical protein